MELISLISDLMPAGKPKYMDVIKYPKITDLVTQYGKKTILKALFLLIKDFCGSINVVRNMNEDQMIEAAANLLNEADNFRLEDYTMMFAMAKKGELYNIFDHLDIQVITEIHNEYWSRRYNTAKDAQEAEIGRIDSLGDQTRLIQMMNPEDAKLIKAAEGLEASIEALKDGWKTYND